MNFLRFFANCIRKYYAGLSAIGVVLGFVVYFEGDLLKNIMGSYWFCLFLFPILYVVFVAIKELLVKSPVEAWKAKINEFSGPDSKIYWEVKEDPQIENIEPYVLTANQKREAEPLKAFKPNDIHAMVAYEPSSELAKFRATALDFAELTVLRKHNMHQFILSANSVMICREKRLLILHHRAKTSATYPDRLHTIGGAYQPGDAYKLRDRGSLKNTAQREAFEEIGVKILYKETPPMILVKESITKFIQLVFLGVNVSGEECDKIKENWIEGGSVKVSFDDLEAYLMGAYKKTDATGAECIIQWVPTGRAHVLAWLAFGAPNAGARPKFGDNSPEGLFEKVVKDKK